LEIDVVWADRVEVEAAEMDEMWSYVHDKGHQCWLWWAIDHNTKVVLAYCFGTRERKYLDDLLALLSPFKIKCVYCDDNFAYQSRVRGSVVLPGKRNTQRIERKHLSLRTWCSRLVRKGIRFSKLEVMHHTVIGLIINFWFFKRNLPFNLL
jgi:insertion element IS1 protein InsB